MHKYKIKNNVYLYIYLISVRPTGRVIAFILSNIIMKKSIEHHYFTKEKTFKNKIGNIQLCVMHFSIEG